MNELRFSESRRGEVLVLAVSGEVGITTAPIFQRKLAEILATGEKKVILDLAETTYIASSGLGAISQTAKEIRNRGGDLCLARVQYLSREVMNFFGLMPIVKLCKDVEEALKVFDQPEKR